MTVMSAEIPEDIRARLEAAERVCAVFSWCGVRRVGDRDKALIMLWRQWRNLPGTSDDRDDHPGLTDEALADLARQDDEIRELERMRCMRGPGEDA
jgi:hypothetical protein